MVGEQYLQQKPRIRKLPLGQIVIVDAKITIESIYHWFYMGISFGYLAPVITTNVEKYHSFWLAFSIPLVVSAIGIILFIQSGSLQIKTQPNGSALSQAIKVLHLAFIRGRSMENAKPSNIPEHEYQHHMITWDDKFIDELRGAVQACKMCIFHPIYFMCFLQANTNLVSQAATMETSFVPNDILNLIDPITVILLIPFMNKWLYPFFRRRHIELSPVKKIFLGFLWMAVCALLLLRNFLVRTHLN